jgi:cytosine/adenosine deaminase-related metal-dependent hydrolase
MPAMRKAGCAVALGIDSKALDDDDDSLRELRLAYLLHAGTGFDHAPRHEALHTAVRHGRFAVTNIRDTGALTPGAAADLLLLDWAALDDDALLDNPDPVNLLFSRATARHIHKLIVDGRTIVADGHVTGVDLPAARREVVAQMRKGLAGNTTFAAALDALGHAVAHHHLTDAPCC